MGHPENVCSGLPNYPIALEGASGGLLAEKYPMVCGGLDYSTYEYVSDCIVLGNYNQNWFSQNFQYSLFNKNFREIAKIGKPELSTKLITGRAFSYGLEIGVDSLWITGGKGGEFGEELKSTEIVKINEATTPGPELPIAVAYHCMTKGRWSTFTKNSFKKCPGQNSWQINLTGKKEYLKNKLNIWPAFFDFRR